MHVLDNHSIHDLILMTIKINKKQILHRLRLRILDNQLYEHCVLQQYRPSNKVFGMKYKNLENEI